MKAKAILHKITGIAGTALTVLLALLLALNLYVLAAQRLFHVETPTVFGYSTAVVLTGSMSGTIEPDDLIVSKRQSSYKTGDIITFRSGGSTVTHRITAVTAEGFRTKGDANNAEDGSLVHYKNVIGTPVFTIPGLGYVANYIQHPPGTYVAISAAAVLLLLVFLPDVLAPEKKKSAEK